jgi:heat-inducible transcriptional repressor
MYLQGQHQLLHQPEFYDIDKAKRFLSTLNKESIVAAYLDDWQSRELPDLKEGTKAISNIRASKDIDNAGKPAFMVRIGQEIALEGMEDCSFITTTYRIGGGLSGQIALIGPRRMPYCRSIAQISFVNQALTDEIRDRFYGNAEDTAADDSSNK